MALFLRDVKQAWRAVRSYAWSSALAIALLALAIGANGTIFTLINAVMLQPLPVHEPDRLVSFGQPRFSYRQYEELRHRVDAFDPLFAWSPQTVAIGSTGRTDSASALVVSGEFLSGLGVGAAVGRPLLEADDAAQSGSGEDGEVAVLGYDAWTRRFSADPAAVGETIRIENVPFKIVGVAPRGFHGVAAGLDPDIYIPARGFARARTDFTDALLRSPAYAWLYLMARLASGTTVDGAPAQLRAKWPPLLADIVPPQMPAGARLRFLARRLEIASAPTGESALRQEFSRPLLLLMALVALVLVAACANIANVLLARTSLRRSEFATRLALGASRRSLFTQLVAEAAICAFAAAVAGVWLASVGADAIVGRASTTTAPVALNVSADWRFLLFASGLGVLSTVACGFAARQPTSGVSILSSGCASKDVVTVRARIKRGYGKCS